MSHVFRILDANFNRAAEGLRVVEDFVRFDLNDPYLSEQYKRLRHQVGELRQPLTAELLAARDTMHDVGTDISTDQEQNRQHARHVATASQQRIEQALRCIEEYAKTIPATHDVPNISPRAEQLRYTTYTLGRTWQTHVRSRERLHDCRLYVLVDGCGSPERLEQVARAAIRGGADVLQWREKTLSDRELAAQAKQLRAITTSAGCLLVINDRPDIAIICNADGVHVGQDELEVQDVRNAVGSEMLIGVSTHDIQQARQAVMAGADYIGCGPVFPSSTKAFANFVGTELLTQVAEEIGLPAFAIGGITRSRVEEVVAAGFRRAAVSRAVIAADCPETAAREIRAVLTGTTGMTANEPDV